MESSYTRIQKLRLEMAEEKPISDTPDLQQISVLQQTLKTLAKSKQQTVLKARATKEPLKAHISEVEARLNSLNTTYKVVTDGLTLHKRKKESFQLAKNQAYEASLQPLESLATQLDSQLDALHWQQAKLTESTSTLTNLLAMHTEEINTRLIRKAESIAHREEMEETLENLKEDNPLEFEENANWDMQNELLKASQAKTRTSQTLATLKAKMHKKDTKLSTLTRQNLEIQKTLVQLSFSLPTTKAVDELEKLEMYLDSKAREFQTPYLDDLVLEQLSIQGLPIETAVLKTQLSLIQEVDSHLTQTWKQTETSMKAQLEFNAAEHNWDSLEVLEDKLHAEHRTYHKKVIAIRQWTATAHDILSNTQKKPQALDQHILDQFKGPLLNRVQGLDARKAIQHLINVYTQKLRQRECSLQEKAAKFMQKNKEWKRVRKAFARSTQALQKLTQDCAGIQTKFQGLVTETNKLAANVPPLRKSVAAEAFRLQEQINYWAELVDREHFEIEKHLKPGTSKVRQEFEIISSQSLYVKQKEIDLNSELKTVNAQINAIQAKKTENSQQVEDEDERRLAQDAADLLESITTTQLDLREAKDHLLSIESNTREALWRIEKEEAKTRAQLNSLHQPSPRKIPSPDKQPLRSQSARKISLKVDPALTLRFNPSSPKKLQPLLETTTFYKKFADSLKQRVFDPLDAAKYPPESCGYGKRELKLVNSSEIHIKQGPRVEKVIDIDEVLKVIIPERTMSILKVQKKNNKLESHSLSQSSDEGEVIWPISSQEFSQLCRESNFYQLSIALKAGGRIDLVATNYLNFKHWVHGLNFLLKVYPKKPVVDP